MIAKLSVIDILYHLIAIVYHIFIFLSIAFPCSWHLYRKALFFRGNEPVLKGSGISGLLSEW